MSAVKTAVAMLLALTAVLVPVEAPRAPEPIGAVFGTSAAAAQTVDGTPESCRDLGQEIVSGDAVVNWPDPHDDVVMNRGVVDKWRPQPGDPEHLTSPVCELEIDSCPPVPWPADPAVFLAPSMEFPDFCEIMFNDTDPLHTNCADEAVFPVSTTVLVTHDLVTDMCTVRAPMHCPVGMRIAHDTCQVTLRRDWTCPGVLVKGNGFNTCFEERTAVADPANHPACGTGAPDFGSLSCADYAGTDYLNDPGAPARGCDTDPSYRTGLNPPSLEDVLPAMGASAHWCTYNARHLDARCHSLDGSQPHNDGNCAQAQSAYCLKRSSDIGGCAGVAHTIRCAVLLEPHLALYQQTTDPQDLRSEGCTPCIVLPFSPSTTSCPDDIAEDPDTDTVRDWLGSGPTACDYGVTETEIFSHGFRHGDGVDSSSSLCSSANQLSHMECPAPPAGSLTWATNHLSARAVVNSPIAFRLDHVPVQEQQVPYLREIGSSTISELNRFIVGSRPVLTIFSRQLGGYPSNSPPPPPPSALRVVSLMAPPSSGSSPAHLGELASRLCSVREAPAFVIEIEELWPDIADDRELIDQNFDVNLDLWRSGASAADEAEQQRLTSLRGLRWVGGATPDPERNAEIDRRRQERTDSSDCNSTPQDRSRLWSRSFQSDPHPQKTQVWCRWTPVRSGWYRVTGRGAWVLQVQPEPQWRDQADIIRLLDRLNSPTREAFDAFILAMITRPDSPAPGLSAAAWAWCHPIVVSTNATFPCSNRWRADEFEEKHGFLPTLQDLGLEIRPDGWVVALPTPDPADPEWHTDLYRQAANGHWWNCPSLDIRIRCDPYLVSVGKYTETEPVYIEVHEVRTRSVPTSP